MEKIWNIKPKIFEDPILQILYNRGVIKGEVEQEAISQFLYPNFSKDFFDPKLLPDYRPAIKRIKKAIDTKEKIGIYADYDADGIPGAALLFRAFKQFGLVTEIYIPTRKEGYGFNKKGIDFLISSGCKLIISVDLGIRELDFANYIKNQKIDLIITDHHEPGEQIPEALAVVDPKRVDSSYPFKELSGAGVVFKLLQGLSEIYPKKINEKFLKWNLDLVAISTIADVVPLISENRLIAKYGLLVLRKTKNIGLQELYKVCGIDQGKIDAYTVGFQIGPRINAPGRLDYAIEPFKLLTTEDINRAYTSANYLQKQNDERQLQMDKIFREAIEIIDKKGLSENKIIMVSKSGWAKGVIGPVASQLVEKYFRPAIVLADNQGILDGSCRSVSCFNIVEALERSKEFLLGFGGHKAAAGVHLNLEKYEKFRKFITKYANEEIKNEDLLPRINIDLELKKSKISISLIKKIEELEPFGLGNPRPVFLTKGLRLSSYKVVGRESQHLQLKFSSGSDNFKGVVFNHSIDIKKIENGKMFDIVYQPQLNFWNGKNWIDLRVIDIKEA